MVDPTAGTPQPPGSVAMEMGYSEPREPPVNELVAAVRAYHEGLVALRNAFAAHLRTLPAYSLERRGLENTKRTKATPLLGQLLRGFPELYPQVTADEIDANVAAGAEIQSLVTTMKACTEELKDTRRMEVADGWRRAAGVYASASHRARAEVAFDARLKPVRALLKRGNRTDTAALAVGAAEHTAAKATARAQAADAKLQAAVRKHARVLEAHADRNPGAGSAVVPPGSPRGGTNGGSGT